ncbi:hypothetical protein G7059_03495 [Erysipelothrix sp. HDW6A]|uniref:hypothetical protein n=1 Tax=Erysipelothrix sp. HDW6A TaxID=2714928 RepID=UPI00140A998D|nr:hypothetical protein [Erysipelothrix sp. HDW6A]QIK56979.1 hypothetical protein G7059_03495 [Erysipelothrix sp. HDW6A]
MRKIINEEINDNLLSVSVFLLSINQFVSIPWFVKIQKICGYFGVAILLVLFIHKLVLEDTNKTRIIKSILLVLFLTSVIYSGRQFILVTFLLMMVIEKDNIDTTIKIVMYTSLFSILITVTNYTSFNGVSFENYENRTIFGREISVLKESLGYNHANKLFLNSFIPFASYLYLNFGIIKRYVHFIFVFLFLVLFFITFSRTGLICYLFSHFAYFFVDKKYSSSIMKFSFFTVVIFSFLLPMLYMRIDITILSKLNRALSDRIRYSADGINLTKLTAFGTNIDGLRSQQGYIVTVDNSFVLTLVSYGYVVFGIMMSIVSYVVAFTKNRKLLYFILIFGIYYFAESYFFSAIYNFSLLLIGVEFERIYNERKNI